MSHHLILSKNDKGEFWVDTGHADVGPFDTRKEVRAHMDRIILDQTEHEEENHV